MKVLRGVLLLIFCSSCLRESLEVIHSVSNERYRGNQKAVLSLIPAEWNVGDSYVVSILFSKEDPDDNAYGVVFAANQWDNVLPRDTSLIQMKWLSSDTLKIEFDASLRILDQTIRTRDNVIIYKTIEKRKGSR